jgi:hypothetical protein
VKQYVDGLPKERRDAIRAVREVIVANLPKGYEETMDWGMISYHVPLATYPETYNGKPLMYAALASQKGYMVVYLSAIYAEEGARAKFEAAYRATGKKYDVGQSCVRFRTLEDLPLEVIGDAIASTPMKSYIERYEESRRGARGAAPSRSPKTVKAKPKKKK